MRSPIEVIIKNKTLEQILIDHQHWIDMDCDGWEYMKADLSGANLRDTDLSWYCLSGVDLHYADLRDADLRYAVLCGADLRFADLRGANLSDANLNYAVLCGADLGGTCLYNTYLAHANLSDTNLRDAKGKLMKYRQGKILTEDIIGYKKCVNDIIVTLKIPRGAIVFSINGNKCRTNKAKVIDIEGADRAYSKYKYMSYYVGDEFNIYNFNCMYNEECGEGIHFFMTREEAKNYY